MRHGSHCRVSEMERQTLSGVQDKAFLLMFLSKCVSSSDVFERADEDVSVGTVFGHFNKV